MQDPTFSELPFEERLGLLVDIVWSRRKSNRLTKLIKSADFHFPGVLVEDIEYHTDRKLDKAQITKISSCSYIGEAHNIVILGASGAGKTYIYGLRFWIRRLPQFLHRTLCRFSTNWLSPGVRAYHHFSPP